jgi:hypothetical protein
MGASVIKYNKLKDWCKTHIKDIYKYDFQKTDPITLHIYNSLSLKELYDYRDINEIPTDNLIVDGEIDLTGVRLNKFPSYIKAKTFYFNKYQRIKMPRTLIITNDLHLYRYNLTDLPQKMIIDGMLTLSTLPLLTKLPDEFKVGDSLHLDNLNLTEINLNFDINTHLKINNFEKLKVINGGFNVTGTFKLAKVPNLEEIINPIKVKQLIIDYTVKNKENILNKIEYNKIKYV